MAPKSFLHAIKYGEPAEALLALNGINDGEELLQLLVQANSTPINLAELLEERAEPAPTYASPTFHGALALAFGLAAHAQLLTPSQATEQLQERQAVGKQWLTAETIMVWLVGEGITDRPSLERNLDMEHVDPANDQEGTFLVDMLSPLLAHK